MHYTRLTVVLMLVVALSGAISAPFAARAQDAPPRFSPDAEAAMQAALDSVTATGDTPGGITLLVDAPTARFAGASGLADLEAGTPLQPDDAFRIGSITKMFTATVMLQLQEEGVLSLDDPLSAWLPEIADGLPNGSLITLRMLLNHTSGIYEYTEDTESILGFFHDPYQSYTPQQIIDRVIALGKANFVPGDSWSYSNTNYILAGMIIEAATGMSAARALRARIIEPLGLTHTYLDSSEPPTADLVPGYTSDLSGQVTNSAGWNVSFAWTAGAMVSTPSDLARFIRALFAGELFASPETLREMQTTIDLGDRSGYGLGILSAPLDMRALGALDDTLWGHNGGIFGYASTLLYAPNADLVLVVLMNSDHGEVMNDVLISALRAAVPELATVPAD